MYNSLTPLHWWSKLVLPHQVIITNHRDVSENHRVENANRLIKQVKLCLINTYKVYRSSKSQNSIKLANVHKVQIRPLARRISVLHPRHKVDKGAIKIKYELTYARNKTRKACQAAKKCTRTAHMSKMYSVDDEIQFLITCSYFATQRTSLLVGSKLHNTEFDSLSNNAYDKFIYIMSSTHRPLVVSLAKYTYTCF